VVVHTDITGRKRTQQRFEQEARTDRLTGLLNRSALERELDGVLTRGAQRGDPAVALLFVDLDGFKGINDAYGHAVGDEVLRLLGGRLRTVVRPEDLVGRLGGDEFVVVLTSVPHPDVAIDTAERLVDVVSAPLAVGEHLLTLGASVGIARAAPGEGRPELLGRADAAMYRAKRAGGGHVVAPGPA
jgi:diguanylate cyclase (GGDEF)-like protein